MKVLIVDDAAFMRMTIRTILEKQGFEIIEAKNGIEAIKTYAKSPPDLVLMDITMPEMNGIEALKNIRKLDNQAKVIMCSAMGQEYMVRDAVVNGAIGFIVKPFNEEKLLQTIRKLLI